MMSTINKEVIIAALASVTIIECFALYLGFDGVLLTTVVGGILGLAGWSAPQLKVN